MSERMGNGTIQISITVYPDLDGGDKYNKSVTRAINIDHLGGLGEMFRISSSFGSTVVATIDAMLMTLAEREEQEAKAAAEAEAISEMERWISEKAESVIVVDNTAAA